MPRAQWGVGGASGSRAYNLYGKDEDNEEVACSGSQRGGSGDALARSELGSVQQLPRGSHAGEGLAEQEDGVGEARRYSGPAVAGWRAPERSPAGPSRQPERPGRGSQPGGGGGARDRAGPGSCRQPDRPGPARQAGPAGAAR